MSIDKFTAALLTLALPAAIVLGGPHAVNAQPPAPSPPSSDQQEEAEYLLRGPIHEAFAEPVNFDPQPGLVVPKAPPEPVPEMPPEVKPFEDATWISGYWAWDDQREDFIWVSGVYRVPPPGQRWVPGYWQDAADGYQWIPGFWTSIQADQVEYLPEPPESLERGPSSPAPSEEYFWVSGCWQYQNGRYAWRSGYWAPGHDNWVWVPAHYAWTPHGCVYVAGYWDYQLVDRGMCFTPVYFRTPIYARSGYYYGSHRVIDLARLSLHLFVRPQYCHYYFGDWYGPYERHGIYASFNYHGRRGYDPLWTYNNWHFSRRGIDYGDRVRGWHRYFENHEDRRPPHTWDEQQRFVDRNRGFEHLGEIVLASDLKDVAARRQADVTTLTDEVRKQLRQDASSLQEKLVDMRRNVERSAQVDGGPTADMEAIRGRLKLPELPDVLRNVRPGEHRVLRPDSGPADRDLPSRALRENSQPSKKYLLEGPRNLNEGKEGGRDALEITPELPQQFRDRLKGRTGLAQPPIDMNRDSGDRSWRDAYRPPPFRTERGDTDRNRAQPNAIPNPPSSRMRQQQGPLPPQLKDLRPGGQSGNIQPRIPGSVHQSPIGNAGTSGNSSQSKGRGGGNRGRGPKGK